MLGFDIRVSPRKAAGLWDEHRRQQYLLKDDSEYVLSVDTAAWPSLFRDSVERPDPMRRQIAGAGVIPRPDWTGPNGGLWDDLTAMREHVSRNGPAVAIDSCAVAIEWVSDQGFAEAARGWPPYRHSTRPAAPDPDWRFLGYDVSEGSLLSGLCNCGYDSDEAPLLRELWSNHLNQFHLFSDLESACQFRNLTDERVSEHAPFVVCGLYLAERAGSGSLSEGLQ